MENREVKHQVVIDLRVEIQKEMEEAENKYRKILKNHSEGNEEEVKEMKHIQTILRNLRITEGWLQRKMIKLEEEA